MNTTDWTFVKSFSHISTDSRDVVPGTLFVCKGKAFRREYLLSAIERGAAAYVAETDLHVDIPYYPTDDVLAAQAAIANAFYGEPWRKLELIGLTGTKGKSTTLYYLKSIFETAGVPFGYLSTIETWDGVEKAESHLTTPEAFELGMRLSRAAKSGIRYFGMEVSSQGLKYRRTDGVRFAIGAFLNFGADHIGEGEHTDIEDYFTSKLKIFDQTDTALVNLSSDRAKEILAAAARCKRLVTFSDCDETADYYAAGAEKSGSETVFTLCARQRSLGQIRLCMPGFFNVENAVAAAAIALLLGFSFEQVQAGLAEARAAGRMEVLRSEARGVTCVVDYAHNTLSFERLFSSLRAEYPGQRIEALFGCPGGKGLSRRVDLPKVAAKYCDYVWITEEDPYREDPMDISREVLANLERFGGSGEVVVDRSEAIRRAVTGAAPGTVVVILGKGREGYQHRNDGYEPIESDYDLTKRFLEV